MVARRSTGPHITRRVASQEKFRRHTLGHPLSGVTAQTVRIRFHTRQGHQLCAVTVAASAKPVFAK
jgi:hypothetical protein